VTAPLTLIELLAKHPGLFYLNNRDWFRDEGFMRVLPNEARPIAPTSVVKRGKVPTSSKGLPLAVDLANAYVNDPTNTIWDAWLWCRDVDAIGQRIFLGGCALGKGLQLHRHLAITAEWGTPRW
jgi:hypothetical protein